MTYRENAGPEWVRCCDCATQVEMSKADMTELGFRCTKCSLAAMGIKQHANAANTPELAIPTGALLKPAGANPNLDGTVTCISCGRSVPLKQADIVGEGYRCAVCSHHASVAVAHGDSDIASHLSRRDRHELGRISAPVGGGLVLLVCGVVLLATTGGQVGIYLTIGGVVSVIAALVRQSS